MWNIFKVQGKIESLTPYINDIKTKLSTTIQKEESEKKETRIKDDFLKDLQSELQAATEK